MSRFLIAVLLLPALSAPAANVRDLCELQGARGNMLKGIGIVVGLAGTGDSAQVAALAQERVLRRFGVEVDSTNDVASDNSAIVVVTAEIPAGAKEGTRIDVKVDSLFDAESLEGGTLLETHLTGPGGDDTVYAVAQGAVSVGGFNADAGGTSVRLNHVTAGRIPMGAYIEREVPSTITDGRRLVLQLKAPDFQNASRVQEAIVERWGEGTAAAFGPGTVRVTIPEEAQGDLVGFIAELEALRVGSVAPTRVVINERTGTIVVGGDVMISPCQVAHGGLVIEIATTPIVVPALPFTDAQPLETEVTDVTAREEEARLVPVSGTSAAEVAEALNQLKITPRDMIAIFQAIRRAGALTADLEIM